jgi:very-short-patch-repair endonuclease
MYDEDFNVTYDSEKVAMDFNITHTTLVKWIREALKKYPQLKDSFIGAKQGKRLTYTIDEAGHSYLCNRKMGMKPASSEYEFKFCIIPFLNEMGYYVEYQKTILTYRVDFYVPQLNLVIEYDEDYHRRTIVSQYDIKREQDIITATGCEFARIPARYDTIRALGYIAEVVYKIRLNGANISLQR